MYEEIIYYSDGLKIASHLYTPKGWREGDPPRPAIICLHGYSGMKEVYGMDVPRRLWEEGYFILAPDHRGFGKSEGERGRQRPLEQAQDTYDAITNDRPYRKMRSDEVAREEIRNGSGSQYDPKVVEAFLAIPPAEWIQAGRQNVKREAGAICMFPERVKNSKDEPETAVLEEFLVAVS